MHTPDNTQGEIRPDSTQTVGKAANRDIKPTTGLGCVRFDAALHGCLSLASPTPWGNLLALGALAKAGKQWGKGVDIPATPTDLAGLELLADQLSTALGSILDALELVGRLAGLAGNELDGDDAFCLGWLISGLSALGNELRQEADNAHYELQLRKEAGLGEREDTSKARRLRLAVVPGADGRRG